MSLKGSVISQELIRSILGRYTLPCEGNDYQVYNVRHFLGGGWKDVPQSMETHRSLDSTSSFHSKGSVLGEGINFQWSVGFDSLRHP